MFSTPKRTHIHVCRKTNPCQFAGLHKGKFFETSWCGISCLSPCRLLVCLTLLPVCQAVAIISDIRKEVPVHLELASMTDRDYMNSIMQEVHGHRFITVYHYTLYYWQKAAFHQN